MIAQVLRDRITLMPGGKVLLATMKANGAYAALVSGGFTAFTSAVAGMLDFDENRANTLHVADGKLAGTVAEPILEGRRDGGRFTCQAPRPGRVRGAGEPRRPDGASLRAGLFPHRVRGVIVRDASLQDCRLMTAILNRIIAIGGTTAHEMPKTEGQVRKDYLDGPDVLSSVVADSGTAIRISAASWTLECRPRARGLRCST